MGIPVLRHRVLLLRRLQRLRGRPEAPPSTDATASTPLLAAIDDLTDVQREIIMLRYSDQLSLAAIAEALEINVNTAKSRLHQAIATLRADPRAQEFFGNR